MISEILTVIGYIFGGVVMLVLVFVFWLTFVLKNGGGQVTWWEFFFPEKWKGKK